MTASFIVATIAACASTGTHEATTVTLARPMHFDAPDGKIERVVAGTYEVREQSGALELLPGEDEPQLIRAVATSHEQDLDEPFALCNPDEEGNDRIVLLLPGGKGFEAVGTPAAVRPRGNWPPRARRRRYASWVRRARMQRVASRPPAARTRRRPASVIASVVAANRGKITSARFGQIVAKAFRGAYFRANAAAGSYKDRKTTLYVPGWPLRTGSLSRLNYKLGNRQKKATEHKALSVLARRRITAMRAAIDHWKSAAWRGSVEKGKFILRIPIPVWRRIKCRAKRELQTYQMRMYGVWTFMGLKWGDSAADAAFADFMFSAPRFDVLLTPVVDRSKRVSYSGVQVAWHNAVEKWGPGRTYLPELREKVIDYKNQQIEVMRQRIRTLFASNETRNLLANAIMQTMAPELGGTVTGVTAQGSTVRIVTAR